MYTRYFWQGSHHTYGHIRCVCTALANPTHESTAADHPSNNCTRAPASVQCHRPAVSDLTANVTRKHSCLQRHKHSCLQRHTQALSLTTSQALLLTTSQARLLTTSQALLLTTSHTSTLAHNVTSTLAYNVTSTPAYNVTSTLAFNVTRKHSCLQHPTLFYPQDPAHATWRAAADDRLAALLCTQGTPAFLRHWYANRLCVFVCACASLVRKQAVCVCVCMCVTGTQTGCVRVFVCACASLVRKQAVCVCLCVHVHLCGGGAGDE